MTNTWHADHKGYLIVSDASWPMSHPYTAHYQIFKPSLDGDDFGRCAPRLLSWLVPLVAWGVGSSGGGGAHVHRREPPGPGGSSGLARIAVERRPV
jgi:hypothetical protein